MSYFSNEKKIVFNKELKYKKMLKNLSSNSSI